MDAAANVNNIYALMAVLFVAFVTPILLFFKKDSTAVRLVVGAVVVAIFIFLVEKATALVDLDKFTEETRSTQVVINSFDSAELKLALEKNRLLQGTVDRLQRQLRTNTANAAAQRRLKQLNDSLARVNEERLVEERKALEEADKKLTASARKNIKWIFSDKRARATYTNAAKTRSPFDAAIYAQKHNPSAQSVIKRYGKERTEAYIKELLKK